MFIQEKTLQNVLPREVMTLASITQIKFSTFLWQSFCRLHVNATRFYGFT